MNPSTKMIVHAARNLSDARKHHKDRKEARDFDPVERLVEYAKAKESNPGKPRGHSDDGKVGKDDNKKENSAVSKKKSTLEQLRASANPTAVAVVDRIREESERAYELATEKADKASKKLDKARNQAEKKAKKVQKKTDKKASQLRKKNAKKADALQKRAEVFQKKAAGFADKA